MYRNEIVVVVIVDDNDDDDNDDPRIAAIYHYAVTNLNLFYIHTHKEKEKHTYTQTHELHRAPKLILVIACARVASRISGPCRIPVPRLSTRGHLAGVIARTICAQRVGAQFA